MVTIMSVSYFQEGVTDRMSSNVSSVFMIHAHIPNLMLQNILSSRCAGCCSIFRETLICIGNQHGILAYTSKSLGFRVDTRTGFGLNSNIQVMVSNLMMFAIIASRLGQAQDVHFFYTRSHLSAIKSCASIFSTNF